MEECEIYLPTTRNDGTPVDRAKLEEIKETLVHAFGGYTQLNHRSEGAWRLGGVTFRDEVAILRVLDDGSTRFDLKAFQKSVAAALEQEAVLIVKRQVTIL